jgi:hypothetical protein
LTGKYNVLEKLLWDVMSGEAEMKAENEAKFNLLCTDYKPTLQ